jgi:hypothetical protein
MAGDPEECHANARQCLEMAKDVKHVKLKEIFLDLAAKWTKLAIELEMAGKRRGTATKKSTKK